MAAHERADRDLSIRLGSGEAAAALEWAPFLGTERWTEVDRVLAASIEDALARHGEKTLVWLAGHEVRRLFDWGRACPRRLMDPRDLRLLRRLASMIGPRDEPPFLDARS